MHAQWETILAVMTKTLAPRRGAGEPPRYALDRALRLVRTLDAIAAATPEPQRPRRVDLAHIAALYACVPCAPAHATLDEAVELAGDQLKDVLIPQELELVLRILRAHRDKQPVLPEARLLADALALEDFGMVGVWNQTRTFHAAGKTLEQFLRLWKTQQDYGYWEARLKDSLHFPATREAATRRLHALHAIFDRLRREHEGADIPTGERTRSVSDGPPPPTGAPRG